MGEELAFDVHLLAARLGRAAERLLVAAHGTSYRRYLTLLAVGHLGTGTQRDLAQFLGVAEPSVSRMCGVLAERGLLDVAPDPGGGNRRRLTLTPAGEALVGACREVLERRFSEVVSSSGVPYDDYARHTRALAAALDAALVAGEVAGEGPGARTD